MRHSFISNLIKEHRFPDLKSEWNVQGLLLALAMTLLFTAANVYLGMKLGMTFATSIPAAIISMGLFRLLKSDQTAQQTNFVQTIASAAGALSNIFMALPALVLIGWWADFPFWPTILITLTGGCLGVLFTVPLRRAFVVQSDLPYPEGVACAEIIRAGIQTQEPQQEKKRDENALKPLIAGGIVSAVFTFLYTSFNAVADQFALAIKTGGSSLFRFDGTYSLALVGTGYLVGFSGCFAWLVGTFLGWDALLVYFQLHAHEHFSTLDALIKQGNALWVSKVRLVGAGVIATSSLWILIRLFKPVLEGVKDTFGNMTDDATDNRNKDLSKTVLRVLGVFFLAILCALCVWFLAGSFSWSRVWLLAFIGVTSTLGIGIIVTSACGYMAGLLGASSSPISGIGVIGILAIAGIMALLKSQHIFSAHDTELAIAYSLFLISVIMASCAVANDNLQDLKTGEILKASPWVQEIALLIGCVASALIIPWLLNLLYHTYGFSGHVPDPSMDIGKTLPTPQASLLESLARATLSHTLDMGLLLTGALIGVLCIALNAVLSRFKLSFPPLALGLGLYLPGGNAFAVTIGAILALIANKPLSPRNILLVSGLIVGESLAGIAGAVVQSVHPLHFDFMPHDWKMYLGPLLFALIIVWLAKTLRGKHG